MHFWESQQFLFNDCEKILGLFMMLLPAGCVDETRCESFDDQGKLLLSATFRKFAFKHVYLTNRVLSWSFLSFSTYLLGSFIMSNLMEDESMVSKLL